MKLLFVDCCISQRGENSRTAALAKAYLEGFRSAHPDAQVETVTPQTLLNLRPFDVPALNERDALASVGAWDAPVFDLAWAVPPGGPDCGGGALLGSELPGSPADVCRVHQRQRPDVSL